MAFPSGESTPSIVKNASSWESIPPGLRKLGLRCWLYLGVAACVALVALFLGSISGLVVPFLIALILAMLFHPLADRLARRGMPGTLPSLTVLVLILGVVVAVFWILVAGILNQSEEMILQVRRGFAFLAQTAKTWNLPADVIEELSNRAIQGAPEVASGLASWFSSGLSGSFAFFMGSFAAVFLLFSLLDDWDGVTRWAGGHLGLPPKLGAELVRDATATVREYFSALTVSSFAVSAIIWLTMTLLDLPLAFPIALVTMATSYIPYLGAIFAGAFAVLIALGSGGMEKALVVLVVVLFVQNVVQTLIQNRLASKRLQLHPIVTFCTVLGGGILFGILGATLANPVAALFLTYRKRVREFLDSSDQATSDTEAPTEESVE